MKRLLCVIVLLSGCASGVIATPQPRQDEALAIIVREFGGAPPGYKVPLILWRVDVDCDAVGTGELTGFLHEGVCLYGLRQPKTLLEGPEWIEVALPEGWKMSQTALTHEVGHSWLEAAKGNADGGHASYMFCASGQVAPCEPDLGRAYEVRSVLAKEGL